MGNTESSCAYLSSLHTAQDQFRLTLNTTEGGGGATAAVFTSKVDYIDPSLQSLLPPSTSQQRGVGNVAGGGNNSGSGSSTSSGSSGQQQPQQHQPHVTCLMTSVSVWASRRAVLERSAHIARMTTHPNIFRCVKSNENSTKQFTVIGAPQIEWLAPPPSTAAATTGGDRLQQWSVSETIVGVAGIVDAVATLLSTQTSNSVLTSLRLHQVAVAMHRGVSASHRIDEGTVSKMGASYFDASYVHAGRWVLHDMTTLEPQPKSGDGRIPIGVTLRSVALFVLEVLGGVGRHAFLRSEIFDVVRRSLQPRTGFGAPSADDAAPDASPQRRQLSTGGTLADDLVTSSGASADDSRIATPPASPSPQGASGGGGGSSASATLVAMRTVESIFSILMEDIQMTIERGNHNGAANLATTNNNSLGGGADGSFGAISNDEGAAATNAADNNSSAGTNSSPPSRSSATPVHLDQAPSFASPSSDEPSSSLVTCTSGVERLLQWLHYALMDAVPRAPYLRPHDIVRLLEELRDILRVDLKDPLSALLRHGQSLYLYSAHDEHHGSGASKKLDAYEEMCHAAFVIRRDYVSNQHHLSTTTNNSSFTATSSSAASSPQSTAWERRVLRWLLHPSHVAQPEAFTLLDYIFSTIGSPTALISKEVLEAVAVDWLTEVRNPSCRAAALRYGNVLFGALPPDRLAGLLTSAGYVFMQGRTCLSRFMHMNLKSKTTQTTMTPVIPPSHVVTALNCVRAFVEAAPALVEELLCSPYLDSIDRSMNKFLLQHVLLKELALLLRACAVVDDMMVLDVYGNRAHQGVTKLLKQTLQTFAVLATPCLQRLSSQDYKSPLQDVLPSALWFVSSCGYGVYYGTTESRERVFSIISALLLHGHVKSAATSGQIVDSGGGLPVSNVLIMRWWLPMVTPLCGSSDARLRLAACHLAGALTKLLSAAPQQNATSAPVPSVVAALLQGMAAAAGSADAAADGNVGSDDESPDGVEDVQHTLSTMNHSARSPAMQQHAASNASSGHRCRIPLFHDVFRSQDEDLQRTHGDDLRPPSSASDNAAPALSSDAMMQRYITQYQKTTYAVCFAEAASARSSKDENAPPTRPARQTHPSGTKACGVPSKEYLLSPEGGRNTMFFCLGGRIDQEDTLLPQLFY